jgi:predicted transcriptional regulator
LSKREKDPVFAVVAEAPVVEADPEEAAAFEAGLADIRAGRVVPAAEVRKRLDDRSKE